MFRILRRIAIVAVSLYAAIGTAGAAEQAREIRVDYAYEKARKWILANPEETAKIIAEEAKLSLAVARLQLTRNDFSNPVPGAEHIKALKSAAPILIKEELVKKGTDVDKVIDDLVDPTWAKTAVR